MGSIVRGLRIERFIKAFGDEIVKGCTLQEGDSLTVTGVFVTEEQEQAKLMVEVQKLGYGDQPSFTLEVAAPFDPEDDEALRVVENLEAYGIDPAEAKKRLLEADLFESHDFGIEDDSNEGGGL